MLSNDQCSKGMHSGALSRGTNCGLTIRSSRCRFAARLNSGVDMIDATVVPKGLINPTFGATVASIIVIF